MIITISREFASGGREIGLKLAKRLGFAYFDKEILDRIKQNTGFSAEYINATIENNYSNFLYSGFMQGSMQGIALKSMAGYEVGSELLQSQTTVLLNLAKENENCVIIGRCADYILRDFNPFKIFVYSTPEAKIKRCRSFANEYSITYDIQLSDKKLMKHIKLIDKKREKYYKFCTGKKWGDRANYDLMINTQNWNDANIQNILSRLGSEK